VLKTIVAVIAFSGPLFLGMVPAATAAGKCSNVHARCAIKVGGTCDPVTGRWSYRYSGGHLTDTFNACVLRELGRSERK